jgi:hypothetical protein
MRPVSRRSCHVAVVAATGTAAVLIPVGMAAAPTTTMVLIRPGRPVAAATPAGQNAAGGLSEVAPNVRS